MAGIAGMGRPNEIGSPVPDADIGAAITPQLPIKGLSPLQPQPDMPSQSNAAPLPDMSDTPDRAPAAQPQDMAALYAEYKSQQQGAAIPGKPSHDMQALYDEYKAQQNQPSDEPGFLSSLGHMAGQGLQTVGKVLDLPVAPVRGAIGDVIDLAQGKPATEGMLPTSAPSMQQLIEKAAPSSAIPQKVGNEESLPPELQLGAEVKKLTGIPDTVTPSAVAAPYGDLALSTGVYKGIGKLASAIGDSFTAWQAEQKSAQALKIGDRVVSIPDQISQGTQDVDAAVQKLKDLGMEPVLLPAQRDLLDPVAQANAAKLAKEPAIQAAHSYIADQVDEMFGKVADMSGNYSGARQDIGGGFTDAIKGIRKQEGEIIGNIRQAAIDHAGPTPLPVPNLKSSVDELASNLGFGIDAETKGMKIPSAQDLVDSDQVTNPMNAQKLIKATQDVQETLLNNEGKMSMEDLHDLYGKLSKQTQLIWNQKQNVDYGYRASMTNLKDAVRDELTDKIGTVLEGTPQGDLYQPMLDSFSSKAQSMKDLQGLMKKGDITSQALAQKIASGDMSRKNLAAAENILSMHDPGLWSDLKGQVFQNIKDKNTINSVKTLSTPVTTNWSGVAKDIDKLGEAKDILFQDAGAQDAMKAVTTYGRQVFEGTPSIGTPGEVATTSKVLHSLSKVMRPIDGAVDMLTSFDTNKKVAKYLSDGGIEQVVRQVPAKDKNLMFNFLNKYLAQPTVSMVKGAASNPGQTAAGLNTINNATTGSPSQ